MKLMPRTWWEWLGVFGSIITIISFVLYLNLPPSILSHILSVMYWPFGNWTITVPRWVLILFLLFPVLKILDWRNMIWDTFKRLFLYTSHFLPYIHLSKNDKKLIQLNLKAARFLDYISDTWNNDIRQLCKLQEIENGYKLTQDIENGYEYKMILFDNVDIYSVKMFASFTVEHGSIEIALRPHDLSPHGTVNRLYKGKYDVEFWIENGEAKILINGNPSEIQENKPENYGHYAIMTSKKCTVIFNKLFFINCKELGIKAGKKYNAIQNNESENSNAIQLKIEKAIYGSSNFSKDVTELIRKYITNERLFLIVNNDNLGGDPCPNNIKQLTVTYVVGNTRATKVVKELECIELP